MKMSNTNDPKAVPGVNTFGQASRWAGTGADSTIFAGIITAGDSSHLHCELTGPEPGKWHLVLHLHSRAS